MKFFRKVAHKNEIPAKKGRFRLLPLTKRTASLGHTSRQGWARQPWQPSVTYTRFSAQPLQANLMMLIRGGV